MGFQLTHFKAKRSSRKYCTCCNLAQFVTQEGLRFREAKDTHWPGKYARWTRKYANVCF